MCPSFCPTKTTKHFFPLSCSCSALKICTDAMESRRHAEDNIASPLLFSPKEFFLSLQTIFFSISSICFPLLYLYKKAQTTTFLIKFLRCFFLFHLFFLFFLGLETNFTFWPFFLQGWEKANSRVWRGRDWLIFAVWHDDGELLMHIHFSFGHVTPHCWSHWWIFMGVFCSFHKLKQWLVIFLSAHADVLNFVF